MMMVILLEPFVEE